MTFVESPESFKHYHPTRLQELPRVLVASKIPADEALSGSRGAAQELDLRMLGTLLFLAFGVSRKAVVDGGETVWFRTAMSAGNLHPLEVYVMSEELDGLHHYDPLHHALQAVRLLRPRAARDGVGTTLLVTGVPLRTCWKYGTRGWRHLWWDAGTALANLLAVLDAHGFSYRVRTAFSDTSVAELLDCDGVDEVPLLLVDLDEGVRLPKVHDFEDATTSLPISSGHLRLPEVQRLQDLGKLAEGEIEEWLALAGQFGDFRQAEEPFRGLRLREHVGVEDVILARGSARVFRRSSVAEDVMSWALGCALRPARFDVARASLEHVVNVHAVDGFEPGTYSRRNGQEPELIARVDDVRALSSSLCVSESRAADAALTVFHCSPSTTGPTRLAARMRRVHLLEAGIVAGRLALNAGLLGAAATGLTFYDGRVHAAFPSSGDPLLVTAVGLRQGRTAPNGSPGEPAEIRRFAGARPDVSTSNAT